MTMTPEILTMLGMTATILIALGVMFQNLRGEIKDVRGDIKTLDEKLTDKIENLDKKLTDKIENLSEAQHGLNERMAGVEGLVMGLKEAIVARAVA